MKPIDLPSDTTIHSFVHEILPREHRARVSSASVEPLVVVARLEGHASYTVRVRGDTLTIEGGEADAPSFWIATDAASADWLLADALGAAEFLPDVLDPSKVPAMTDPRLLTALARVEGSVRASLSGVGAREPWIAFGAGRAKKRIDPDSVDCEVVVPVSVARQVVALTKRPEDALRDASVELVGNKFVAVQAALALAQLLPR